ncbi:hypothetical protein Scep_028686 [Stephania cephalantha]|uniref:SHSP domain-containing protein n=1 Tax=Stephania cephalantha TaxID=152367 RepID=A0AAP0EIT3_9MAGN
MSCPRKLEVLYEDRDPKKWRVPLREDMFHSLMPQSEGSLFSPLLFGKFFDPSDAFPLWEFESDILLASLRNSGNSTTDWFEAEGEYVLRAESPGLRHCNIQVIVESEKIMEISGQWEEKKEVAARDWRSGKWWERGCVRRIELPQNADWRKIEAKVEDDILLEIRIPKGTKNDSSTTSLGNIDVPYGVIDANSKIKEN